MARFLRSRLELAAFKVTHNIMCVPFNDLEAGMILSSLQAAPNIQCSPHVSESVNDCANLLMLFYVDLTSEGQPQLCGTSERKDDISDTTESRLRGPDCS